MKEFKDALMTLAPGLGSALSDIAAAKVAIGICLIMSIVWGLIFMQIISLFAEQIAWCVVICVQLLLIAATGLAFYMRA